MKINKYISINLSMDDALELLVAIEQPYTFMKSENAEHDELVSSTSRYLTLQHFVPKLKKEIASKIKYYPDLLDDASTESKRF